MTHLTHDIRLTDELERQLMQEAIEEQARLEFGTAFKALFAKLKKVRKSFSVQEIIPRRHTYADIGMG